MGAAALKTNEGRPGTRAVARHVRVSARKAREVLNLIRGESYGRANEIVTFSERSVASVVGKCLDSAVANAEHNDQVPAEELFVSACYADEGPTLKRWRPRARGRATPIHKRTCHITVVVSRYTPEELERMAAQDALRDRAGASTRAAVSRRERVEKSRAAEAAREAEHEHDHDDEAADEAAVDAVETDETVEADEAVEATDEVVETDEASDEAAETDDAVEIAEATDDAVEVVEATDDATDDAVEEAAVEEAAVDEVTEEVVETDAATEDAGGDADEERA
jgi:large subunit ribosomal protein L22